MACHCFAYVNIHMVLDPKLQLASCLSAGFWSCHLGEWSLIVCQSALVLRACLGLQFVHSGLLIASYTVALCHLSLFVSPNSSRQFPQCVQLYLSCCCYCQYWEMGPNWTNAGKRSPVRNKL